VSLQFHLASRLLNIRLAPDDDRLVRELQARGVSVSSVVRRAIRAEARKLSSEPVVVDALLKAMMERYPTPEHASRAELDTTDRRAVRVHIQTPLRRGR
jgi:hypothetical protein